MKAYEARKLVNDFISKDLNYQRKIVLDKIKTESLLGISYLVLDDFSIKLNETDYEFFEKLGYNIKRHKEKILIPKDNSVPTEKFYEFGVISWTKEKNNE